MPRRTAHWICLAALAAAALAAPLEAQMDGFSREEILKYTPKNPYPRLEDGRPKVPAYWLRRLEAVTTAQAHEVLAEAGYPHQWEGGWRAIHPERKLVGRAFPVVFLPARPDLEEIIESGAQANELHPAGTQRVIDMLQEGDVLVADVMGRIEYGQFGGENLVFGLFLATGNGFVVNGSFRDLDGVFALETPVFARGHHPGIRGHAILAGANVPARIGHVTVMPGDVVLGDRQGVIFIPPHLVQRVVEQTQPSRLP